MAQQRGFDVFQIKFPVCASRRNQFRAAGKKLGRAALVRLAMRVFVADNAVKRAAKLCQGERIRRRPVEGQENFAVSLENVTHLRCQAPAPFVVAIGDLRGSIRFDQCSPGRRRNGSGIVAGKFEAFRYGHGGSPNRLRALEQRAKSSRAAGNAWWKARPPAAFPRLTRSLYVQPRSRKNKSRIGIGTPRKPEQNVPPLLPVARFFSFSFNTI